MDSIASLPFITRRLPGVGGRLRAQPDHFIVAELPLYEPCGEGDHLYVNLTKVGVTTKEVQFALERLFGLDRNSVGFAGLKDKAAVATQTFSIAVANSENVDDMIQRIRDHLPVTVRWARRHRNKLKPGHLLGNQFTVVISELALPIDEAFAVAQAVASSILRTGFPNYFGQQRFGERGDNAQQGRELLLGKRTTQDRWLRRFLISAFQSELCNRYLARRVEVGAFTRLLPGDVAKKHATGGMFDVEDAAVEQPRFDAQEISFTAPLFGAKMWPARDEAGALEAMIQAETEITEDHWRIAKIEGSRRLGRVIAQDLRLSRVAEGLCLEFSLPKGSFATTLLREFMKNEAEDPIEEQV
jgi:tRNA pseudouridine13 synthase